MGDERLKFKALSRYRKIPEVYVTSRTDRSCHFCGEIIAAGHLLHLVANHAQKITNWYHKECWEEMVYRTKTKNAGTRLYEVLKKRGPLFVEEIPTELMAAYRSLKLRGIGVYKVRWVRGRGVGRGENPECKPFAIVFLDEHRNRAYRRVCRERGHGGKTVGRAIMGTEKIPGRRKKRRGSVVHLSL